MQGMKMFLHVVAALVFTFLTIGFVGMILRIMYEGFLIGWNLL